MLPPVARHRRRAAFDRWLERAPRLNAIGLRAALFAIELAPLALGHKHRLRRLPTADRADFLQSLETVESAARPPAHQGAQVRSRSSATTATTGMLKRLGYDPDANVARGRALRIEEGRP